MTLSDDQELARLHWRCRRGLLELDLIFERFLSRAYTKLAREEKAALEKLLQYPDAELLAYVQGSQIPVTEELRDLVKKIKQ